MAGISAPLKDILIKLSSIEVINADLLTVKLYARIWNNQLRNIEDGTSYEWPRPATFVEIVSPATFQEIGGGFRSVDLGIRIHLIHEFYNQDGTFEQDMAIFDLRDQIIATMTHYEPEACGPMVCVHEEQDYDHNNLYHYIMEFVCNFTDSKGSKFDPDSGSYNNDADPNMDLVVVEGGMPVAEIDNDPEFIIIPNNR